MRCSEFLLRRCVEGGRRKRRWANWRGGRHLIAGDLELYYAGASDAGLLSRRRSFWSPPTGVLMSTIAGITPASRPNARTQVFVAKPTEVQ